MSNSLERAYIKILEGKQKGKRIDCAFNPTEYQLNSRVKYGEHRTALDAPIQQFTNGVSDTLTVELFFDTTDTEKNVKKQYTDRLDSLMAVDGALHAPPTCRFVWGKGLDFKAIVVEADKRFTRFRPNGTPVRAWVDVTFKQQTDPTQQKKRIKHESTDKTKIKTVREGETLWLIAADEYGDSSHWRTIATANDLDDPRDIEAGTTLSLPPL